MFGAVMMMKEKKENHGRSPTQLRKHEKKSTGLSFGNVQPRYNLDLPARPDALTYSGGVARSMDIGREHLANKGRAGKRVAIIQRIRNNVVQRCGQNVHGNSKSSTNPQHGYEIYNKYTGDVVKTGISGQKLNPDGSSPRANQQVDKLNSDLMKNGQPPVYAARVVIINMPNRDKALGWEKENASQLAEDGNSMAIHKRPKPRGGVIKI